MHTRKWISSCEFPPSSSMLHGSEIWPVRKEIEVAFQRAEMRIVRWMCNVKVKDRVQSKELRERLGIDDIILILQQSRLRWYRHVLRKEDIDWAKKCMEYEVEGARSTGRPKRTWWKKIAKHSIWTGRMLWIVVYGTTTTPHHNRFMALFLGPPGWAGARRELLDCMVQGEINRGRHTDHLAGRHSIQTNQCPPPPSSHILQAGCPSCHQPTVKALKATSAFGLGRRR